jgi:DNA replicative helicase MCM subunit Mcm2 (Cdc46/Mcm family)
MVDVAQTIKKLKYKNQYPNYYPTVTPAITNPTIPRTLLIKLQHDLVDTCQPGDDVVVVGTLLSHFPSSVPQMDSEHHAHYPIPYYSLVVISLSTKIVLFVFVLV